MKYDDASWHYGGEFPEDLPPEAGATHIGMFLAWAIMNDLAGEFLLEECGTALLRVKRREMTGREFLFNECDEKLTSDAFNDEGNAFAEWYLELAEERYIGDYEKSLGRKLSSLYLVEDSWENYDTLVRVISKRFRKWRRRRK